MEQRRIRDRALGQFWLGQNRSHGVGCRVLLVSREGTAGPEVENPGYGRTLAVFGEKAYADAVAMNYRRVIAVEPRKRAGRSRVRGLRITVGDTHRWSAAGLRWSEIKNDYQEFTEEDIRACVSHAGDWKCPWLITAGHHAAVV